jgi:hypothetical protein
MSKIELQKVITAESRRSLKKRKRFADLIVAAIKANNCEAFYDIGTADDFHDGWRLAIQCIERGEVPNISPNIKATFQQVCLKESTWLCQSAIRASYVARYAECCRRTMDRHCLVSRGYASWLETRSVVVRRY